MSQKPETRFEKSEMGKRVRAYLREMFGKAYREGEHDCVLQVLGWTDELTGSRHREKFAGKYVSKMEGLRMFAHCGLALAFRELLTADGWRPLLNIEPLLPGDVVVTEHGVPGIFDGRHIVSSMPFCAGQMRMPEGERKEAFRCRQ